MKESKPYPRIDEEDGNILTANEPMGAIAYADDVLTEDYRPIPGRHSISSHL